MLSLPPVKENIGRGTGIGRLMPICPASISVWNLRATLPFWVKMAVPLPHGLALVRSIAS